MFVVSLALAAVLIASSGDSNADTPAAAADETATPGVATVTPAVLPSETPAPTPAPPIPFDLRQRLDALPEKLRNETLLAYSSGSLDLAQLDQIVTDYENRNPAVRVGSVIAVDEGLLRFEVFTTGETAEVAIVEQTLVRRGDTDIGLEDLMPEELVMIVTTDEGATALTIEAFGVVAP